MEPLGSNLDLEHSNGACWMRLTRGENGTSTVVSVDLEGAVPTSKDLIELLGTVHGFLNLALLHYFVLHVAA